MSTSSEPRITPYVSVPGLAAESATVVIRELEDRLAGLLDLQLVLKHMAGAR